MVNASGVSGSSLSKQSTNNALSISFKGSAFSEMVSSSCLDDVQLSRSSDVKAAMGCGARLESLMMA